MTVDKASDGHWLVNAAHAIYLHSGKEISCDLTVVDVPSVPLGSSFSTNELSFSGTTMRTHRGTGRTTITAHFYGFQVHTHTPRGVATGGISVYIPPKSVTILFTCGTLTRFEIAMTS